jgi:pSer/pThr/pTyr-binding forkhead associated (FHA) protein
MAFLLFRDGAGREQIYTLEDSATRKIIVGRNLAADVTLVWDAKVSAIHAELERVGDDWTLIDDGLSRNGTFVNGERLQGRCRLKDGDLIRLGETIVLYRRPPIGSPEETLAADTGGDLSSRLLERDTRSHDT